MISPKLINNSTQTIGPSTAKRPTSSYMPRRFDHLISARKVLYPIRPVRPGAARSIWGCGLWQGAELWVDPEIDQGFGLSGTHGIAGFVSGEAYKQGADYPYARLPRYFIRQTIDLGGETEKVEADANQFGGSQTANRLVITIGKFGVADADVKGTFDSNEYAHEPRDFLNWALVDTGTFDYAADAWGFTYGALVEWYKGPWTLRGGIFDLSIARSPVWAISVGW